MRIVEEVKARYTIAKNMLTQSRRGAAWGRNLRISHVPEGPSEKGELARWMDAHEEGNVVFKWEHYLPIYERHLAKFRDTEVVVVEIGVYSGGSLEMWRDYFGPKSHIYGIDINEVCRTYEAEGIDIFIGDQADPDFWRDFIQTVPDIDIVIDDGGHLAFQQLSTLEGLLPHIRPGGVYLCEDIVGEYNEFLDYLFGLSRNLHTYPDGTRPRKGMTTTKFQRAIDSVHLYPFVAVIEKRAERVKQFVSSWAGSESQPASFWDIQKENRAPRP